MLFRSIDAKFDQREYGAFIASCYFGKFDSMTYGPQTPFLDPDNFLFGMYYPGEAKNQSHVDDPVITDTVGWVYYKRQLPLLAIPRFQQSIERDPRNAVYHFHLGLAYAASGESAKARDSLEHALQLNPAFDGADAARQKLVELKG